MTPPTGGVGPRTLVVKIGSSSVTTASGRVDTEAIDKLAEEVAWARSAGNRVVVVTSGAIAAGRTSLAPTRARPTDLATLQALSAVGQHQLMRVWSDALGRHGLTVGQVLLAPLDFVHRSQYLHARQTLARLLELGVVPVVNENDAVADEEIRFGDNDRLAALVAHLVGAQLLVLLTDTAGLFTEDPRHTGGASLIEEVVEIDHELERIAGGPGSAVGSGGMGSKLAAAKIAAWSGVEAVIADAADPVCSAPSPGRCPGWAPGSGPMTAACPPASCGSPSQSAPPGPSSSMRVPVGHSWRGAAPCCLPGCSRAGVGSLWTTPSRSPGRTGPSSPRAWSASRPPRWRPGRAGNPTISPRTSRPRWSTATTWWYSNSGSRAGARSPEARELR